MSWPGRSWEVSDEETQAELALEISIVVLNVILFGFIRSKYLFINRILPAATSLNADCSCAGSIQPSRVTDRIKDKLA